MSEKHQVIGEWLIDPIPLIMIDSVISQETLDALAQLPPEEAEKYNARWIEQIGWDPFVKEAK